MSDNRIELFKGYIGQLIHGSTSVYFTELCEYPIDVDFLTENSYFAGAFASAYWDLPLREVDKEKNAEGCYKQWKRLERNELLSSYCYFLNSLIEEKALERSLSKTIYLPNMLARKGEIIAKLEEIDKKYQEKASIKS